VSEEDRRARTGGRGQAGEEEAEAAADTELKTKTPHVNVGKNPINPICTGAA